MSGDTTIQILGIATGGAVAVIPIWSAAFPAQRIWLPQRYSRFVAPIIWMGTITSFGAALSIGASGRATAPVPCWAIFGLGFAPLIIANMVVWRADFRFGFDETPGAKGTLATSGPYRYSSYPQYARNTKLSNGDASIKFLRCISPHRQRMVKS